MADEYNRAMLKSAVGRLCQVIGWQVVQGNALETLVDILQRYLLRLGSMSKRYGEIAGRSNAEFCDLALVMGQMGVSVNDLKMFTQQVETMPPQHSVFNTLQEMKLKHFQPKGGQRIARLHSEVDAEAMPEEMDVDSDESDELMQYLPPMVSRSNTDTIPDEDLGSADDCSSPSRHTAAADAAASAADGSAAAQRAYDEASSDSQQPAAPLVARKQSVPSQVPPSEDRLTMPVSVASQYRQEAYTGLHAVISVDGGAADSGGDSQAAKRAESSQPGAPSEKSPAVSKPAGGPVVKKGRGRPPGKTQKTLQKLAELAKAKDARRNKAKAAAAAIKGSPKSKVAAPSKEASPLVAALGGSDAVKPGQTLFRPVIPALSLAPAASPTASCVSSDGRPADAPSAKPASVHAVPAAADAQRKKKPHGHSSASSKSDKKLLKKKKRKERPPEVGLFAALPTRPGALASLPVVAGGDGAVHLPAEQAHQKPLVITLGNLHKAEQPPVEAAATVAVGSTPGVGGGDSSLPSAAISAHGLKKKKKKKHSKQAKDPSLHSEGSSQKKSSSSKPSASSSGRHFLDAVPATVNTGKIPELSSTPVKSMEVASHGEPTSTTPQKSAASTAMITPTASTPAKGSSVPSSLTHTPDAKKSSKSSSKKKPASVHSTPQSDSKKKHKRKRKHDDPAGKSSSSAEPPAKKKRKKKPETHLLLKIAVEAAIDDGKAPPALSAPSSGMAGAATLETKAQHSSLVESIQFSPVADSPESQLPSSGPGWPMPARKLGALDRMDAALLDRQEAESPLAAVPAALTGLPGSAVDMFAAAGALPLPEVTAVPVAGAVLSENVYLCPICHKPDDGGVMITCDKCNNDLWYHIGCVGLQAAPTDNEKWFCPPCRKKADKKMKKKKKEPSQPKGSNPPSVKIKLPPLPPVSATDDKLSVGSVPACSS